MAETEKAIRLLKLYLRFVDDGARLTIAKMQADYGVNRRTVTRDLEDLQNLLKLDLQYETLSDNTTRLYFIKPDQRRVHVRYKLKDLLALLLGRRLFDFLEGTSLEQSLDEVYGQIHSRLERTRHYEQALGLMNRVHMVSEGPKKLGSEHTQALDVVIEAILSNRAIRFGYENAAGRRSDACLHPYTLVAFRRGLYVLGPKLAPQGEEPSTPPSKLRLYALERMTDPRPCEGPRFELPNDYDPAAYFQRALWVQPGEPTKVDLAFDPKSLRFIGQRRYHHSQTFETMQDGRLRMTLEVPAGKSDFEIVNFVLGFGPHVEVLAPVELRERVKAEIGKMWGVYEKSESQRGDSATSNSQAATTPLQLVEYPEAR
jgi:predicted DNA-binding transcriptional regulator YafY